MRRLQAAPLPRKVSNYWQSSDLALTAVAACVEWLACSLGAIGRETRRVAFGCRHRDHRESDD